MNNYKINIIRKKTQKHHPDKKIEHCCYPQNCFSCVPSRSPLSQPSPTPQVTIILTFMVTTSLLFKVLPIFELYT